MHKILKELTLLDRFLFDQTMDCPEAHEAALQIIFGDPNLRLLTPAQTESERIRKIHSCVQKIRTSEEMGVKYMQAWEEKALERLAGKAEGLLEGKAESILELLEELGPVPEELRKKIMDERDLNTLKGWLKLAAKTSSVENFCFLLDSREKI